MADEKTRFWEKVEVKSPTECWEWKACCVHNGYGQFRVAGKGVYAHRYSFLQSHELPEEKFVLHKCNNRKCVNPNHLYAGTRKDNAQDSIRAGTRFQPDNKGERSGLSKLREKDVFEIKASPLSSRKIAPRYGVSKSTISSIRAGTRWGHL
jgi:hypothetical protein